VTGAEVNVGDGIIRSLGNSGGLVFYGSPEIRYKAAAVADNL
jgi:hypothetical protein